MDLYTWICLTGNEAPDHLGLGTAIVHGRHEGRVLVEAPDVAACLLQELRS